MSEPIVFVSHHRVKPGKLDQLKSLAHEIWATVEMEKPRTLMNLADLNQDGTEVTFTHAFADIDAMQLHGQGADDRTARPTYTSSRSAPRSTGRRRRNRRRDARRSGRCWRNADALARVCGGIPPAGASLILRRALLQDPLQVCQEAFVLLWEHQPHHRRYDLHPPDTLI
jgi:hypothetical protein